MTARLRTVLLAAALLLVAPGVAGAAATPGDYGGGGFAPRTHQPTWMWARVAPDSSARIGGRAQLACGLAWFDAQVTVAPDGSFRFFRRRVTREGGHVVRANVTVAGRFAGGLATGTLRARVRDRTPRGTVQRCATRGARAWKLNLRPAAGAPGPAQPSGAYLGLTSQAAPAPKPFVLRVNRRASRVALAIFDYVRRCGRRSLRLSNVTPGGRIRPDGTFSLREGFTLRYRGGIRERFRIGIDGRFTAGGVGGSLRVTTVARRDGREIDRCDTGPLTFAALL